MQTGVMTKNKTPLPSNHEAKLNEQRNVHQYSLASLAFIAPLSTMNTAKTFRSLIGPKMKTPSVKRLAKKNGKRCSANTFAEGFEQRPHQRKHLHIHNVRF